MTVQAQFLTHETAPLQEILVLEWMNECGSRSVMSDCNPMDYMVRWILQARILEWVACSLLQGIFPIQGQNLGLPHCRQILNQLSHRGSPKASTYYVRNTQHVGSLCAKSFQSCLTLCDPMDCSPPGCSSHGILQARRLEWAAITFSRGSSQPRDRTLVPCIAGRFFTVWATGKSC